MQHVKRVFPRNVETLFPAPAQFIESERGERTDERKPGGERKQILRTTGSARSAAPVKACTWAMAFLPVSPVTPGTMTL
jgi:hypothetical protein